MDEPSAHSINFSFACSNTKIEPIKFFSNWSWFLNVKMFFHVPKRRQLFILSRLHHNNRLIFSTLPTACLLSHLLFADVVCEARVKILIKKLSRFVFFLLLPPPPCSVARPQKLKAFWSEQLNLLFGECSEILWIYEDFSRKGIWKHELLIH